jgi:hypothetical protein
MSQKTAAGIAEVVDSVTTGKSIVTGSGLSWMDGARPVADERTSKPRD